jgi:hypothetical protein
MTIARRVPFSGGAPIKNSSAIITEPATTK